MAEVLAPDSERGSVAWESFEFSFDPDAYKPEDGEEVDPEEAAGLLAAAQDAQLAKQVFEAVHALTVDTFHKRKQYRDYIEGLTVVQIEAQAAPSICATEFAYYRRLMDSYEDAGDLGVTHVVFCIVEHVAENCDDAQQLGAAMMRASIAAFLQDAEHHPGRSGAQVHCGEDDWPPTAAWRPE